MRRGTLPPPTVLLPAILPRPTLLPPALLSEASATPASCTMQDSLILEIASFPYNRDEWGVLEKTLFNHYFEGSKTRAYDNLDQRVQTVTVHRLQRGTASYPKGTRKNGCRYNVFLHFMFCVLQ